MILIPLLGGLSLCFFNSNNEKLLRLFSLFVSLLVFFLSSQLLIGFDESFTGFQFVEYFFWNSYFRFGLGIDGLSLFLITLTTFLLPICILTSWSAIKQYSQGFFISLLFLESFLIAVFSLLDLLLFYIAFEATLLPMFFIVGIWGSRSRRINAAFQLFMYTLLGSVFMLIAILFIWFNFGSTDLEILFRCCFDPKTQIFLWLGFFLSFAIKIPMFPFHIWLPEAHVEAPTAGSVILAGILLKLGGYGFLRFSFNLFPEANAFFTPFIFTLSVLGIVYASLSTLQQIDLKKIIAYSSVAHMGFVTLGLFSANPLGVEGSVFLMLSHGLVSSALFLCVGVLYDRFHTRLVRNFSGLTQSMPLFSFFFLFLSLANLGLPLTSSFVGEFLILIGLFQVSPVSTVFASLSLVLGAAYSIWLANRILFGSPKNFSTSGVLDLTRREFFILLPFLLLIFLLGVLPDFLLEGLHFFVLELL